MIYTTGAATVSPAPARYSWAPAQYHPRRQIITAIGVLLGILAERFLVAPWAAVAIAGALFSLAQLLQVRSAFQAMVLGTPPRL